MAFGCEGVKVWWLKYEAVKHDDYTLWFIKLKQAEIYHILIAHEKFSISNNIML